MYLFVSACRTSTFSDARWFTNHLNSFRFQTFKPDGRAVRHGCRQCASSRGSRAMHRRRGRLHDRGRGGDLACLRHPRHPRENPSLRFFAKKVRRGSERRGDTTGSRGGGLIIDAELRAGGGGTRRSRSAASSPSPSSAPVLASSPRMLLALHYGAPFGRSHGFPEKGRVPL